MADSHSSPAFTGTEQLSGSHGTQVLRLGFPGGWLLYKTTSLFLLEKADSSRNPGPRGVMRTWGEAIKGLVKLPLMGPGTGPFLSFSSRKQPSQTLAIRFLRHFSGYLFREQFRHTICHHVGNTHGSCQSPSQFSPVPPPGSSRFPSCSVPHGPLLFQSGL